MNCPLLVASILTHQRYYGDIKTDCLKEECAWWDKISCCCQMTYLKDIASALVRKGEIK